VNYWCRSRWLGPVVSSLWSNGLSCFTDPQSRDRSDIIRHLMGSACSSESEGKVKPSAPKVSEGKEVQPRETHAHRFKTIRDNFESTDEVTTALRKAGLEASDLIVAVDLTRSNERSGAATFHGTLCTWYVVHTLMSACHSFCHEPLAHANSKVSETQSRPSLCMNVFVTGTASAVCPTAGCILHTMGTCRYAPLRCPMLGFCY
jgi:hypothetical protein